MAQKYKLIYCARILDDKHAGMLKIGDTEFTPTKPIHKYEPRVIASIIALLHKQVGHLNSYT